LALSRKSAVVVLRDGSEWMSVVPRGLDEVCGVFRIEEPGNVQHDELCREAGEMRVVHAAIPPEELNASIARYQDAPARTSARRRLSDGLPGSGR
jgi:hypothetical protein